MKKVKPCIICDRANPYDNIAICDLCHNEYEVDELKELVHIYYQNLYSELNTEKEVDYGI